MDEWLQIQTPYSFMVTQISLLNYTVNYASRSPNTFYLLGSTDGTTWNNLLYQTGQTFSNQTPVLYTLGYAQQSYSYYRLVITLVGNSGVTANRNTINISQWSLTGIYITSGIYNGLTNKLQIGTVSTVSSSTNAS